MVECIPEVVIRWVIVGVPKTNIIFHLILKNFNQFEESKFKIICVLDVAIKYDK